MIDIHHLTYAYPRTDGAALVDVSLHVKPSETVLLTGRSGSGKSTLLGAINGLIPHYYGGRISGRVVVGGRDTRHSKAHDLAAMVGTAFQEPASRFITREVGDELAFGLEAAGLSGADVARRVRETVERMNLAPLLDRPLEQLSGGEQQRVAVAAALARQPSVLVLDEPTSQLDAESAQGVLDWLRDLCRSDGLTTLVSEHRLTRLLPWVDRVAALGEQGRLDACGSPADVLPRLAHGGPLVEAARALGLPPGLSAQAQRALRDRLMTCSRANRSFPLGEVRLQARGVGFEFHEAFELKAVDLEVRQGEALAVLGANGSGKTTLLRCLMGLLAHRGEVVLDGAPIHRQPVAVRARHLAYVPQWPSAFLFADTVRDELRTTLRYRGLVAESGPAVEAMLRAFRLERVADRYPRDLSAGERQRTALAAVMVAGPKVVLLDEPTLGMDPQSQTELAVDIGRWRRKGLAVVVATHDVEFAAAVTDRAVVLERGRLDAEGPTPQVLFDRPELRTALQRLTGRAWPACVADLRLKEGGGDADD